MAKKNPAQLVPTGEWITGADGKRYPVVKAKIAGASLSRTAERLRDTNRAAAQKKRVFLRSGEALADLIGRLAKRPNAPTLELHKAFAKAVDAKWVEVADPWVEYELKDGSLRVMKLSAFRVEISNARAKGKPK